MSSMKFKEYTIQRKQVSDEDDIIIALDSNGDKVGELFCHHEDEEHMTCHQVDVIDHHRRKGIASAMYEFQEEMSGKKFIKSPYQTELGEKLWTQKGKKFG